MTKIKLFKTRDNILAFECFGHSGYAESGEDIVCAAISSIVQMAEVGVVNVLNLPASVQKNEKAGRMVFRLTKNISQADMEKAQIILKAMELSLEDLAQSYPKFIKLEVKNETH